ncbi:MAG: RES family NAD+ phosphorylase [Sphingomonadales bacterium]|nr:RES family NAD+ phosphorylase [Sphingomonadales bacterium]
MSEDTGATRVCSDCIGEPFLRGQVAKEGLVAECDYCGGEDAATIALIELADAVEGAFERHFEQTAYEPDFFESALQRDKELDYEWWREGEPVLLAIAAAADISEALAQDVLDILTERHAPFDPADLGGEPPFDPDSQYEETGPDDAAYLIAWDRMEQSLRQRTRFFNREADALLSRLFADLDALVGRGGRPVVVTAGPGCELDGFHRARAFHSGRDEEIVKALERPDRELGPPPARLARAGRMNAAGIAVFYGADDPAAALAEIRPPVGSRVVVGRFELVRPVRLLDIEALRSVFVDGSVFDPEYLRQLELAQFLGRLSERMTMPVMPDDEPTEYLITQVIADFVARRDDPGIDGMLYRSVQSEDEHRNVVLFHHAARVAAPDIPPGTEIEARTTEYDEDGPSVNYWVSERVPAPDGGEDDPVGELTWPFGLDRPAAWPGQRPDHDDDPRDPALRLDAASLKVHHVKGVTIAADEHAVWRHRHERARRPGAGPGPGGLPDLGL